MALNRVYIYTSSLKPRGSHMIDYQSIISSGRSITLQSSLSAAVQLTPIEKDKQVVNGPLRSLKATVTGPLITQGQRSKVRGREMEKP